MGMKVKEGNPRIAPDCSKASNELYRRRQQRKAPKKEKEIIKKLSLDR